MNSIPAAGAIRLLVVAGWLLAGILAVAAPSITSQPVSQTVFYGDLASFQVAASGTAPLAYHWFRDGVPIGGAMTNFYSLPGVSSVDQSAGFSVVVTNSSGAVTSSIATLTVDLGSVGAAQTNQILLIGSPWRYEETNYPGASWAQPGFNDSSAVWQTGTGLFDAKWTSGAPVLRTTWTGETVGTHLSLKQSGTNRITYYFRAPLILQRWPSGAIVDGVLSATTVLDDGAIFYLNGNEAYRLGMTSSGDGTYASRTVSDTATTHEYFSLPTTNLVTGTNWLAAEVHQCDASSSDLSFGLAVTAITYPRLHDTTPPTLVTLLPAPGTVVSLTQLEVHFSEAVKNVQAASLLVNGVAATNVTAYAPDVYVFSFPAPPLGAVSISWSPEQTITDVSVNANPFGGGSYAYTLDSLGTISAVRISEFMASNTHTLADEDGHYSDWIELYNSGAKAISIGNWYLTDNPAKLTKWQIPAGVILPANSYRLIWASGNNRTNPAAPLHTSFKLSSSAGNYLGLIYSNGVDVASAFVNYPQQYDDVSYGRDRLDPAIVAYYTNATPGAANVTVGGNFAPDVVFSRVSGTFQQPFTLTLATGDSNSVIRYFLVTNGVTAAATNVPNLSSPLYTGPLTIGTNMAVRARAYSGLAGYFPGPPRTEVYLRISAGAAAFTATNTPIVLLHNFGAGTPTATANQSAVMMVFDTTYSHASMTNPPDLVARIGMNLRGKSTEGFPKKSFAVEVWNEFNDDQKVDLLGLPSESDWVLYAPNGFDKPLIHNPFMYELGRRVRGYSPRTRMVEVFTSFGAGAVDFTTPLIGSYAGVYVLEEKIKVGSSRLDISKLATSETNAAVVSGGYLLKIDQADANERTLTAANRAMVFVEPTMTDTAAYPGRVVQSSYITSYFNSFYTALMGANWTNPVTGYAAWIDTDSWIDNHILNVFAINPDAYLFSSYFYKDRDQKIVMGPLWDYDRALGGEMNSQGEWRAWNPRSWICSNPWSNNPGSYGSDYFNAASVNPWFSRLLTDPDFWQKWIDRYQDLRLAQLSTNALFTLVDDLANPLREAQPREVARWSGTDTSDTSPRSGLVTVPSGWPDTTYTHVFPGTYQGEIDFMKQWVGERLNFMDTNFLAKPAFTGTGGPIAPGATLTITAPDAEPGTTTYYTLNGVDPRLPGGGLLPAALSGTAPITLVLNANTRVVARNRNAAHHNLTGTHNPPISSIWSGVTAATFVTVTPPFAITEIMYHPAPPATGTNDANDFEFIELKNVSGQSQNLVGMHFTAGIDFTFTATNAITNLGPGQYVVLVKNAAAFAARYPAVTNVAGTYLGSLDNSGERLVLVGALQEPILDFSYADQWYPTTDGPGFSLVIRDEQAAFATWTNAASWRASTAVNGSPGKADPAPASLAPVVINEALTHTDLPELDSVELYNPTASPVNIGGWFLTDNQDNPKKYVIPANTLIPAGGYLTFDESQFNSGASNSFRFSSLGEEVYLFSGDGTNLTGYRHGFEFGAQFNGVTFGRHVTSDGKEHFVAQAGNSLGAANHGPKVGPVAISEIMFDPPTAGLNPDTLDEYIELRNFSSQSAPLYDPLHPANPWRLDGGVRFTFPPGVVLAPWASLLVVNFDPVYDLVSLAWFCQRYGLDTNTVIYGPYQGNLANEGETVALYQPDKPQLPPAADAGYVPYVLAEEINYSPLAPWPTGAAGTGYSLQRIAGSAFGDDPANWTAGLTSPGQANAASLTADTDGDGLPDEWEIANGLDPQTAGGSNGALADPDGDGMNNFQEYIAGTSPTNGQDFLHFETVTITGGPNCHLEFQARAGRTYTVEACASLAAAPGWTPLQTNLTGTATVSINDPLGASQRFYRLKVAYTP